MNVKKLARKKEKARKRLRRDQKGFFSQNVPFLPTRHFFPTSLVVSDNTTSCSRVSHQLYLTVEVAYCGISYVVSGHIPSCHILLGALSLCDTSLVACGHITADPYIHCFLCFCWHFHETSNVTLENVVEIRFQFIRTISSFNWNSTGCILSVNKHQLMKVNCAEKFYYLHHVGAGKSR